MTEAHPPESSTPHTAQPKTASDARTAMISNVLGIVGIIILVVIAIWGLLHLVSLTGWFSSDKTAQITVSAPKEVYSGEVFLISWKYTPSTQGTYAILYPCQGNVRFSAPTTEKNFIPLPCGAAFTVGNATNTIAVMPLLAGTSTIAQNITVLYIPSATTTAAKGVQGSVSVNVHPSAGQQVATTTKPVETKPSKPRSSSSGQATATGPADLRITLVALSADQYGNGVASFDIANIGGSSSGTYYFEAQLPTTQPYTYYSPAQASLAPGSHVVNTLTFSQAMPGLFTATVDPQNLIRESNEGNNQIGQYLTTSYPVY